MFNIFENSDNDEEFEMTESFCIDNGELEGITPQEIFVLGAEWTMIRAALDTGKTLKEYPFHPNNRMRIEKMLERRKIKYDISEHGGWLFLDIVGALFPFPVSE